MLRSFKHLLHIIHIKTNAQVIQIFITHYSYKGQCMVKPAYTTHWLPMHVYYVFWGSYKATACKGSNLQHGTVNSKQMIYISFTSSFRDEAECATDQYYPSRYPSMLSLTLSLNVVPHDINRMLSLTISLNVISNVIPQCCPSRYQSNIVPHDILQCYPHYIPHDIPQYVTVSIAQLFLVLEWQQIFRF